MPRREIKVSDLARADLASIFRYSREVWGENRAVAYIDELDAGFKRIAERPEIGPGRSELLDGARGRLIAKHLVFYQVSDERVVVLRVLHPAQDPLTLRGDGRDG